MRATPWGTRAYTSLCNYKDKAIFMTGGSGYHTRKYEEDDVENFQIEASEFTFKYNVKKNKWT